MTSANHSGPRGHGQANGVLQISASQTAGTNHPANKVAAGPKLKVVIRRLPPGLTEAEFAIICGDAWKSGGGRVDWFAYKPGKESKDAAKPSRPSRAYLHLTTESHVLKLAEDIRQFVFEDAAGTSNSSCLLGPPTVEFAPYGRIPSKRIRGDTRSGTIDQDPEFMDFLESLANPSSTKDEPEDGAAGKGEKVTMTPLVQYLKEKKANKIKEAAASRAAKATKQEVAAAKTIMKAKDAGVSEDGKRASKRDRGVEKSARADSKAQQKEEAAKNAGAAESSKNLRASGRERGSIAAAARILQRDLGLSPATAHKKAKEHAGNVAVPAKSSETTPLVPTSPRASGSRARGSRASAQSKSEGERPERPAKPSVLAQTVLKKPETGTSTSNVPAPAPVTAAPPTPAKMPAAQIPARRQAPVMVPSPGATRAFVKHANPSQGVTEALLKVAMEQFGVVTNVEIDRRKGFAFVDFAEHEALVKAMAANPTKIAQGTVQVLERKDNKPERPPPAGPSRGNQGGRGGGSGGGGGGRGGTIGRRGGRGAAKGANPTMEASGAAASESPAVSKPT